MENDNFHFLFAFLARCAQNESV